LDKAKTDPAEALKTSKVSARTLENKRSIIHIDTAKGLEVKTGADNINKITSDLSKPVKPDIQVDASNSRIAILPFDNFSGNNKALGKIMPLILSQLKDRGYDVIDYKEVEAFLCERRVRNSSFISREVAMDLGKHKKVSTVVAGSVFTYSADVNPRIGLMARRLDLNTGHIIWSDFVSLTGEDFTRVLGLGTIKSVDMLIPNVLNNLFATFENRSPEKDINAKYKIAVLPFKNESKHRHAGIIITHLFQNELANNPMFDPVDYGDVKKTIVNLRVGRKGEVDYNNLQELSKSLGVDIVLTGTVEEYYVGQEYSSPPRVTISARLLDSRKSRILWYDNLRLDGEENIVAFDWGRLRSADKVAYGAVSGLVDNMNTKGLFQ
jgi:TolB-like protein